MQFPLGLPFPQLLPEFVDHLVDRCIKIRIITLSMNVRPGKGQMQFHTMFLMRRGFVIMNEDSMNTNHILSNHLQMFHFIGQIGMNSCGEAKMTGAYVNLHMTTLN